MLGSVQCAAPVPQRLTQGFGMAAGFFCEAAPLTRPNGTLHVAEVGAAGLRFQFGKATKLFKPLWRGSFINRTLRSCSSLHAALLSDLQSVETAACQRTAALTDRP